MMCAAKDGPTAVTAARSVAASHATKARLVTFFGLCGLVVFLVSRVSTRKQRRPRPSRCHEIWAHTPLFLFSYRPQHPSWEKLAGPARACPWLEPNVYLRAVTEPRHSSHFL